MRWMGGLNLALCVRLRPEGLSDWSKAPELLTAGCGACIQV